MTQSAHASTATLASARQDGLRQRHAMLEAQLDKLRAHPSADDMEIKTLKREKLRLKEEMAGLRH